MYIYYFVIPLVLGALVQESWHPLFGGQILGASIYHFQEASMLVKGWWALPVGAIAAIESYNIAEGWERPSEVKAKGKTSASLREDYLPGNLNFDPLGLCPPVGTQAFVDRRNKELQNGRLAMLAIAGIAAQELVDGRPILEHIAEVGLFRRA